MSTATAGPVIPTGDATHREARPAVGVWRALRLWPTCTDTAEIDPIMTALAPPIIRWYAGMFEMLPRQPPAAFAAVVRRASAVIPKNFGVEACDVRDEAAPTVASVRPGVSGQ